MELIHTCYRITDIDRSVAFSDEDVRSRQGRFNC